MPHSAEELSARLSEVFPEEVRWSEDLLQVSLPSMHDEAQFLHDVCFGRTWEEVDLKKLSEVYFSPSLYLTSEGVRFLMPALALAALAYPDTDVAMHAVECLTPGSRRVEKTEVWKAERFDKFSGDQLRALQEWLAFINSTNEGELAWLPAGMALELLRERTNESG